MEIKTMFEANELHAKIEDVKSQIESLQIPEGGTITQSVIHFEMNSRVCSGFEGDISLSTSQKYQLTQTIKGMLHENLVELETRFNKL